MAAALAQNPALSLAILTATEVERHSVPVVGSAQQRAREASCFSFTRALQSD